MSIPSIYVIGPEGGPYKVGRTMDVVQRLETLQVGNPRKLILHHWAEHPAAEVVERRCHRILKPKRLAGEWFDAALAEVLDAVHRALSSGPIGPAAIPDKVSEPPTIRAPIVDDRSRQTAALAPVAWQPTAPMTPARTAPSPEDIWGACAPATWRVYQSDWRAWRSWCFQFEKSPLPADPSDVAQFCHDRARAGRRHSTICRAVAAIAKVHEASGCHFEREAPALTVALSAIGRRIGIAKHGKAPLLTADVLRLASTCDATPLGVRDRAMLLLVFAAGIRRGEAVALDLQDIEWRRDGAVLLLRRSKTDQAGAGRIVPVRYGDHEKSCPLRALKAWVQLLSADLPEAVTTGPLFRAIVGKGHVSDRRVTGQMVWEAVKRRCRAAGLDPTAFGAHSLRSGHATQADENGADPNETRQQLGHKRLETTLGYVKAPAALRRSTSAKLGL
jgi:site-specific recombinase XerD